MKKFKIVEEFPGNFYLYKRVFIFFWEYQTYYYDFEAAKMGVKILQEKTKHKPKVWLFD